MISALLNRMNELSADIMFCSNRNGVGSITSWMYITWYVWCTFKEGYNTFVHLNIRNSGAPDKRGTTYLYTYISLAHLQEGYNRYVWYTL